MNETYEQWRERAKKHLGAVAFGENKMDGRVMFSSAFDKDFEKVSNWTDPEFSKLRNSPIEKIGEY